jgi:hypothetical protein
MKTVPVPNGLDPAVDYISGWEHLSCTVNDRMNNAVVSSVAKWYAVSDLKRDIFKESKEICRACVNLLEPIGKYIYPLF